MKRTSILDLLTRYEPSDTEEKGMLETMIGFIREHADCFDRSLEEGHVTSSAWVLDPERTHVLLIHHIKLDKWLQPGGHCDGDADVLGVAMKEVYEETGLKTNPVHETIFDVDNHSIPQKRDIPAHIHYDIRFLLTAQKEEESLPGNSEVNSIQWIRLTDVHRYNSEESVLRMVRKTL